ncbi:MAG: hypothetical protein K2L96_08345 [Muribaculaceae bacterium]|nr:hypothetical protein [Muribaculaceae bacterium]
MKKVFNAISLAVFGCFAVPYAMASGTPFTIDCPLEFDDDLDGWKIEGTQLSRNTGDWFGMAADTPDYIVAGSSATSADLIFTPVKKLAAGEPCTIEFAFNSPGGTPNIFNYGVKIYACSEQSLGSQIELVQTVANSTTIGWKQVKATYTPAEDGDVCFAIQPVPYTDAMASRCGYVGFDSFIIEGTEGADGPVATPFEKIFTFDDDADFTGINTLPHGWTSTGAKPYRRYAASYLTGLPVPPSGEYVIGNVSSTVKHDNILATEFFVLKGNMPATISFNYSAKSISSDLGYGFHIYASTTHDLGGATLIGEILPDPDRSAEWILSETYTFTPAEDGKYCFIITPFNENGLNPGGIVAFDNIAITGYEGTLVPPVIVPEDPIGEASAFSIDCPLEFDDDLDGWKIEGTQLSRNTGDWFGMAADTPDYIVAGSSATSADLIFTPVKKLVAGEPCTIEFAFNSPGGTPNIFNYGVKIYVCSEQSLGSQIELVQTVANSATIGWKQVKATYTPAEDGDVCFAIQPVPYTDAMASRCGYVGFDSFIIEGTCYSEGETPELPGDIELEPNEDHLADCIEVPYLEDFNGGNYDGTSYLPIGWNSTGSVTWVTSSHNAIPAVEGDYYMVAPHNTDNERDDRAYTPFMNLEAGKTYNIDFHVYMQGNRWNDDDILYLPTLSLTVGTEQEADFHNTLATFSQECNTWVAQSHTFTPEKSGPYCFAFMLSGPVNSGYVFVDALKITAEGLIARVEPSFAVKGIYSLMDSEVTVAFQNHPVQMINTSKYAETFKWSVEGAEPSNSTEEHPSFVFPEEGEYTVLLEATNAKGTRKTQRKINVQLLDETVNGQHALTLCNANQDVIVSSGKTPTFDTDPEGDFVTGYNHYYFDLAQRFDFSEETPFYLDQLTIYVTNRRFRGTTEYYDDQRVRPFSLVVYGADENGQLDENNVLGRIDSTIGEVLGSTGLYNSEAKDIAFSEPVNVKGTFYIAMHFDRGMEVVPQDASLGRSFFGYQALRHSHGETTIYAKPFDKPAASDAHTGEWCSIDKLDTRNKGLGSYWILWGKTNPETSGVSAVNPDGTTAFAAAFIRDQLNVSGTAEGEMLEVYNISGYRLTAAPASEGVTVLPSSAFVPGVYIVKSGEKVAKVIKN